MQFVRTPSGHSSQPQNQQQPLVFHFQNNSGSVNISIGSGAGQQVGVPLRQESSGYDSNHPKV